MSTVEETYTHPRLTRISHRVLGPPVAFVVALVDGYREGRKEFRRSYRSIRSWHAEISAKEDQQS